VKKALFTVVGLVILVLGAALVVPGFINWNDYKSEITAKAQEATGRRLAIDGDIGFTILPTPALQVSRLRLSNMAGATAPEMVTIANLEVEVALIPLLSGEIQIKRVRVSKPVISIEVSADSTANYDFGGSNSDGSGGGTDLSLDSLVIEDAKLSYIDAKSGTNETIEGLSAKLSAGSLQGPFKATGRLTARNLTTTFTASTGALNTGRSIPLNLALGLANGAGTLSFKGSLSQASADGTLKGKLAVTAPDALTLTQALKPVIGSDIPELPALKQKLSLNGDLEASAKSAAFNNIVTKIGETTAAGAISVDLANALNIDLALDVNRVNLDTWLQAAPNKPSSADASATAATKEVAPFAIPSDISGTAALTVSGITWQGSAIRQVEASASISKGIVNIEKIAAHLPGGANVDLVGSIQAKNNMPQFEGAVRASADNLRGFLNWVGADISSVPSDRLRSSSLSATVRATPKLAEIYGIDLRLDSTNLTGGAAYAFRARPAFSVDFEVDQLNLDVYQKKQAAAEKPKAATGTLLAPPPARLPPEVAEMLNSFDANLKLAVKKFTANGVSIKGVLVDVGLLGGELTVRNIRTDDLGGAKFVFQGKASGLDGKPVVDGRLDLQAANVQGLTRLAGITLPVPASKLGKFHAAGSIKGSGEAIALDLTVLAARTSTALKGNVAMDGAGPRLDLDIKASNKSYVTLWQTFDPSFRLAPGGEDGPLGLVGKIAGDLSVVNVDLKVALGKSRITAAGKLKPLAGPGFTLALSAGNPSAPGFLRGLGIDYTPAGRNFGALALKADLSGDGQTIGVKNLTGKFGPLALKGTAAASFAGQRPSIAAELQTSEIFVDLFLPRSSKTKGASSGASSNSSGKGVERWSSDPIDLSVLRSADMNISLTAPGIIYGTYQFVQPSVTAILKDGVLRIDPLKGKLFDGEVALTARVADDQVPTVDLALTVTGGNLKKALMEAAQIDAATGTVRIDGKFATRGHSQRDMVSRLSGSTSFASESGIVKGVDLKRLSTNMTQLDRTRDFLNLIQSSMSGGQTNYTSLGGTFAIENGVARSNDLKADLEAGAGAGTAVIDLPRWVLDMAATFRLTEHPKAPPIGLELRGPLDNPRRNIKSRDLENYVASRVGKTLVRKFLGNKVKGLDQLLPNSGGSQEPTSGGSAQSTTQQQPSSNEPPAQPVQQQPQQPLKAEDAVKSLLKGFFKK
jgi:uncharacterized protein involved in outer membrane biogenesis